jgi:PilZ domain-containing protein
MVTDSIAGKAATRKYRRASVHWLATLACRGASLPCVISNLSANGAKVMVEHPPEGQARVTLACPRFGALEGEIVWRSPRALGIRFILAPDLVAVVLEGKLPVLPRGRGVAV